MMTRLVLAGLPVLLLATGCDPYALRRRQAADAALVGLSEAELVRALGVPARTFAAENRRFLAYDEVRTDFLGDDYPWRPPGFGWGWDLAARQTQVVQWVCETTFEVADQRVIGFTLRGNACG